MGFVIISLNKNSERRLIGYAENSIWDEEEMPLVLTQWLGHIDSVCTKSRSQTRDDGKKHRAIQRKKILPLLTCHWHQNSPYNDLAPVISDGNVKTVAGCVAIAAAQIAYYWRKDNPAYTLKDSPVYQYSTAPVTMSVPKGSPNNWELMKDSYTEDDSFEEKYAAAQLCYVIGTTSYLNYASSTGGSIRDASNALFRQYNISSVYTAKNGYAQDEWENLIYREIDGGRPILCSGTDGSGHAFVLDGYDEENDLYHFNFGWGGAGDGYYPIDDSEIAMGGYYRDQAIVYNIQPKNRNIAAILSAQKSEINDRLDVTMDVTNNSTLNVNGLKLFIVPENNSLDEFATPVWQSEDTIICDGLSRHFVAYDICPIIGREYDFYLTDENKYIISQLHIGLDSGIDDLKIMNLSEIKAIYDLHGQKTNYPANGVYIIDSGKKRNKVLINK